MTGKISRINSPLTIIAIFAALAEINATIAISLIDSSLHNIFIWFVIGFPTLLVVLFFATLNYNTKVMYSPSDFRDDKNFIDSLYGKNDNTYDIHHTEKQQKNLIVELEKKLSKTIEDKLSSTRQNSISKEELSSLLENQRNEIQKFTKIPENETLNFNAPSELRSSFAKWISFPAYIPIIYAIIDSEINSVSKLKEVEDEYNLPVKWEEQGLKGLNNILSIYNDKIILKEGIKEPLQKWIELNKETIKSIIRAYGGDSGERKALNETARNRTQNLII